MSYIFIDESGDLGFNFKKKGTSRYFIVAAVKVDDSDKKSLEKIVKKIFANAKPKYHLTGILHATEERGHTRIKLLTLLEKIKCQIVYAVADKSCISKDWGRKDNLYEQMIQTIIQRHHDWKWIQSTQSHTLSLAGRLIDIKMLCSKCISSHSHQQQSKSLGLILGNLPKRKACKLQILYHGQFSQSSMGMIPISE
jgi:hypothetical protein